MGQAKNRLMENQDGGDLPSFLEELLKQDAFKGALEGIAKRTVDKGEESLTSKQKAVLDSYVNRYKKSNVCEVCENDNVTMLSEYIHIAENGVCPTCEYDREKYMRD